MFFTYCSLWFATVLIIFYCVKITNYTHALFIYMKRRISKMVPWMLLASVTTSLIYSLPFIFFIHTPCHTNSTKSFLENDSEEDVIARRNNFNQFYLYVAGASVPLSIFCLVDLLLVRSIWIHTRRMNSDGSGLSNPRLDVHFKAVKSMVLFFFLFASFFLVTNLMILNHSGSNVWNGLGFILLLAYPSLHSIYVICTNKYLKETFVTVLCYAANFTPERGRSSTSS
ncbi:taste receptor type 2 member 40-like [Ascaphus truei]|uniref:taste receptor type 2 member 40-like n=1 Tax=Ascaphus truei TaxID=8439 RepID=UPI003F5A0ED4